MDDFSTSPEPPNWPEYTVPLHPMMAFTPLDRDAPIAYVKLRHDRYANQWVVLRCPYCGEKHCHGAGIKGEDPRRLLGGRVAHCAKLPSEKGEYRLVEWDGRELPSKREIRKQNLEPNLVRRSVAKAQKRISISNITIGGNTVRVTITKDDRNAVWAKSDGVCWYCGEKIKPFTEFHVDHVTPISQGGSNHISNLVPSCQRCNTKKGARDVDYLRKALGIETFWYEEQFW